MPPVVETASDVASSPPPPVVETTPTPSAVNPLSTPSPAAYSPPPVAEAAPSRANAPSPDDHPLVLRIPVGTPLAEAERMLIIRTLEVSDGNKQRAARILGISRRGLYTKLAAYGEHVPADEAAENVNGGDHPANGDHVANGGDHVVSETSTPHP
jgi:DNA-binding NtrC family response regulator